MPSAEQEEDIDQLKWMRFASICEGSTLILLLVIAVPLKHLAGFPIAVRVMGPIHGLAFVFYFYTLIQTISGGRWRHSEVMLMIVVAFIPFGAFFNERRLARRARSLVVKA